MLNSHFLTLDYVGMSQIQDMSKTDKEIINNDLIDNKYKYEITLTIQKQTIQNEILQKTLIYFSNGILFD